MFKKKATNIVGVKTKTFLSVSKIVADIKSNLNERGIAEITPEFVSMLEFRRYTK